jgi:group I intron endonuclease
MPYKVDVIGIYKIVNMDTQHCYVGQSQRAKKRLREHFRMLRAGTHTNRHLQHAYKKHGAHRFYGAIEIVCDDVADLDFLEEMFIRGDAHFDQPVVYNIADFAKAPMRGKTHSHEIRMKISAGRSAATFDYRSPEYRATLSRAQVARCHADPKFVGKLKFILENLGMPYAEMARRLGADTSNVRKLAIKYAHLKGVL